MNKKNQSKRYREAAKTLREIQEQIEPLTKPIKMGMPETNEQWRTSSGTFEPNFTRVDFLHALRKVARPLNQQDDEEL